MLVRRKGHDCVDWSACCAAYLTMRGHNGAMSHLLSLPHSRSLATARPRWAHQAVAIPADKGLYFLRYKYVPDIMEKRDLCRAEHLEYAADSKAEGRVVAGGASPEPLVASGDVVARDWIEAVIVFKASDPEDAVDWATDFVAKDPYVLNELVLGWDVSKWNVVVGDVVP